VPTRPEILGSTSLPFGVVILRAFGGVEVRLAYSAMMRGERRSSRSNASTASPRVEAHQVQMLGSSDGDDAGRRPSATRYVRFCRWQHSDFEQIATYRASRGLDIEAGRNPASAASADLVLSGCAILDASADVAVGRLRVAIAASARHLFDLMRPLGA